MSALYLLSRASINFSWSIPLVASSEVGEEAERCASLSPTLDRGCVVCPTRRGGKEILDCCLDSLSRQRRELMMVRGQKMSCHGEVLVERVLLTDAIYPAVVCLSIRLLSYSQVERCCRSNFFHVLIFHFSLFTLIIFFFFFRGVVSFRPMIISF